jgi:hypothetical protein
MNEILMNLVVEDVLSATVAQVMLKMSGRPFVVDTVRNERGFGAIKTKIRKYNQAAHWMPYLVITDLDNHPCPVTMVNEWIDTPRHKNLIFRVAVREVEAWLLADREHIAQFLQISSAQIDRNPETLQDPKGALIQAVKKHSRNRNIRTDIVPIGTTSSIGPNYNGRLSDFVMQHWDVNLARENAPSLDRAMRRLEEF